MQRGRPAETKSHRPFLEQDIGSWKRKSKNNKEKKEADLKEEAGPKSTKEPIAERTGARLID